MLTQNHIQLVQKSFGWLTPETSEQLLSNFYAKLFQINPRLQQGMFAHTNMPEQKKKLGDILAVAIANLNDLSPIAQTVIQLGAQHARHGVTSENYTEVGEALILALEELLREAFTEDLREAWAIVYGILASTMQEGAREAQEK